MTTKAQALRHVENGGVIVTEWRFAPGAETGHHVHAYDYVVIPLTDGSLRIGDHEAHLVAGQAYARPAGVEHNVVNASSHEFRFVEVELKSPVFQPTPEGESR
jgi:quercetin dioxygenase-like cupin family protein